MTQFYGMREFAFEDPDGYVITLAERVAESYDRTFEHLGVIGFYRRS